ncbi:MAG TPA: polysaccharide deacetylase family protein [Gemmatimonadaceae bacterium]|nr:polysaccharide deacetylase family protein [Gemmatimonadaceae bacterium]
MAEKLGYPKDSKLLILHADDLGAAHSINAASFEALDKGAISSASFMIPTPWISEVAEYARAHPDADLGIHLTITSEWDTYRWGSVLSKDKVPSLLDSSGTLARGGDVVEKNGKPAEIESELRAQLDRARTLGIRTTHADSHMAVLFMNNDLFRIYAQVARDYKIPFMTQTGDPRLLPGEASVDTLIQAFPDIPVDKWKQFYLDAIARLKPGVSEIIVHLGHDDAELKAVMVNHEPWGAAWRQRDYDVVFSPEFRKALKDNNVILVKWKDLYRAAQMK